MGGCRNYGPFSGTLNIRCHMIIGIQKGTIILTTTHILIHTDGKETRKPNTKMDAVSKLSSGSVPQTRMLFLQP